MQPSTTGEGGEGRGKAEAKAEVEVLHPGLGEELAEVLVPRGSNTPVGHTLLAVVRTASTRKGGGVVDRTGGLLISESKDL